jgi:hypothetical protein
VILAEQDVVKPDLGPVVDGPETKHHPALAPQIYRVCIIEKAPRFTLDTGVGAKRQGSVVRERLALSINGSYNTLCVRITRRCIRALWVDRRRAIPYSTALSLQGD